MKISVNEKRQVEATAIKVYAKPCDSGSYELVGPAGESIHEHDGYVPRFFPGDHFGDYLILDIDLATGQIKNWKPPTQKQLEAFVAGPDADG